MASQPTYKSTEQHTTGARPAIEGAAPGRPVIAAARERRVLPEADAPSHPPLRAALQVASVMARTSWKRALHLAIPPYFVLSAVAMILFAPPQGVRVRDVTNYASGHFAFRTFLVLAWVLLTLPMARELVLDARAFFLRALPIPRAWLLTICAMALFLLHLPWFAFWFRGEGPIAALALSLAALAVQNLAMRRVRPASELAVLAAASAGLWLAPSSWSLVPLVPAFVLAYVSAWRGATEPAAAGRHAVLRGPRGVALASAFGVSLVRAHGSAIGRGLLLIVLACLCASFGFRPNRGWSPQQLAGLSLGLWSGTCVLVIVTVSRPLLQVEAALSWLLDLCAVPLRLRVAAELGFVVLVAALASLAFGAVLARALGLDAGSAASSTLGLVGTGMAWAVVAAAVVRATTRGTARDSRRSILLLLGLYALNLVGLALYPDSAPWLLAVVALGFGAHATRIPLCAALRAAGGGA